MNLILLVFAFVCEAVATFGIWTNAHVNLFAAGLAFYFISLILGSRKAEA